MCSSEQGCYTERGGGQRSGPCSEFRLLSSVVVITTETLAASNSKALIYPSQTAPPAVQWQLSFVRNVRLQRLQPRKLLWILYPRTEMQSPAVLCPVTMGIQKRTRTGARGPNSTFRRFQTAAPQRCKKVGGQSEYVHAASDQASPQKDPDAHKHTCSHVQAAEHL